MEKSLSMISLKTQDILLFQKQIKEDLYRLFETRDILLLPVNGVPVVDAPWRDRPPLVTKDKTSEAFPRINPVVEPDTNLILLPFTWQNEPIGIAIFKDPPGSFKRNILLSQWPKISALILDKVRLYKAYFTDVETGFLNSGLFKDILIELIDWDREYKDDQLVLEPESTLKFYYSAGQFSIIFMGLVFRRQNGCYSTRKPRPGYKLDPWRAIIPDVKAKLKDFPFSYLFRIDKSTFALVIPFSEPEKVRSASRAIIEIFNKKRPIISDPISTRDRFKLAIGLLSYPISGSEKYQELPAEKLYEHIIERGLETLAVAQSRPDYAFCLSEELDKTVSLKMIKNIHQAIDRLRINWDGTNRFSLILAKYDAQDEKKGASPLRKKINSWIPSGQSIVPCTEEAFFLYLPETDTDAAFSVGKNLQYRIKKKCGQTVSMGLVSYPMLKYKKEEIPFNAYKALVHTSFFGPGTITAFDAVSLNISGDMLFNAGHIRGAIMEYKKGLSLDQQNINLLNSLGVCYAELKWYKRAISCFEKALAIEDNSFMAQYNLGSVYLKAGIPDKALSALEQAASLNGSHFDTFFQLGKLLQRKERWSEAIDYFQKASQCPDVKGYIYRYLGETYLALESKKEAMVALKKAVKVNGTDAFSFSHLGLLYAELKNDLEIAHSLCEKALELDHQNGHYWKAMGRVYYLKNDYSQAIYCFKEARQRLKRDHEIYYHLGLIYKKTGKIGAAQKKWQKALKINPFFKEAQTALQSVYKPEE